MKKFISISLSTLIVLSAVSGGFLPTKAVAADTPLPVTGSAFITYLYSCALNRQPDDPGLTLWLAAFESGNSPAQLYHGFFDSPEYNNKKITNEQYLTQLYNCILFRSPDPGNYNIWLASLNNGSLTRSQVLDPGFLQSLEFRSQVSPKLETLRSALPPSANDLIAHLYACVLDRAPDALGVNWIPVFNSDGTAHLYHGFFDSAEYHNKNVSNERFLTQLYNCVLFRTPDALYNTWLTSLNNGSLTRSQVLDPGFLQSAEFKTQILPRLEPLRIKGSGANMEQDTQDTPTQQGNPDSSVAEPQPQIVDSPVFVPRSEEQPIIRSEQEAKPDNSNL